MLGHRLFLKWLALGPSYCPTRFLLGYFSRPGALPSLFPPCAHTCLVQQLEQKKSVSSTRAFIYFLFFMGRKKKKSGNVQICKAVLKTKVKPSAKLHVTNSIAYTSVFLL